jgi:hypothetical protein
MRTLDLDVSIRPDQQQPAPWRVPSQVLQQIDARSVGPMQIVNDERYRLLGSYSAQEAGHGTQKPFLILPTVR